MTVDSLNASIEKTRQEQKTINDLDKEYQEKLRNAQIENDKLRDDVINNVKRVYVKADCPAVPATPATLMQDPPNLQERLDRIIYISDRDTVNNQPS